MPIPGKDQLRNESVAAIHLSSDVHHCGKVKGYPRGHTVSLKLLNSTMSPADNVENIDVERFNELNITLRESKDYALAYLSGKIEE